MRSDREALPDGFSKAEADKAEVAEAELLKTGGQAVTAAGTTETCQIYYPVFIQVCGAIRDKYNAMGGPGSWLWFPTQARVTNPDGTGKRQNFANGAIYWHPTHGAHPVTILYLNKWQAYGFEAGWVGYPKTDEIRHPDGGSRQEFVGANIYWFPTGGIYEVHGAILAKYQSLGGATGSLGYPLSDETTPPDGQGRMNRFVNGRIYWSLPTGARAVTGKLLEIYEWSGFTQGSWGYPSGDQTPSGSAITQPFQYGMMNSSLLHNAAAVDDGEIDPVFVDGDSPSTAEQFQAGADSDGSSNGSVQLVSSSPEWGGDDCAADESCIGETALVPDGPTPSGTPTTPAACHNRETVPADGLWRSLSRKAGCMALRGEYKVVSAQSPHSVLGRIPFTATTGVVTSEKTGELIQEVHFSFGTATGEIGQPQWGTATASEFNGTTSTLSGPSAGTSILPQSQTSFLMRWHEKSLTSNAIEYKLMTFAYPINNASPDVMSGGRGYIEMANVRCDTTMKTSYGNYRQGCVMYEFVPAFKLNTGTYANVSQAAGHITAAINTGLPGFAYNSPLNRQADITKRNKNRNKACPRSLSGSRAVPGRSCDEYPFASSTQGADSGGSGRTVHTNCHIPDLGSGSGASGYSVCMIDDAQNKLAGSHLGKFYGINRVIDQEAFIVRPFGGTYPPAP